MHSKKACTPPDQVIKGKHKLLCIDNEHPTLALFKRLVDGIGIDEGFGQFAGSLVYPDATFGGGLPIVAFCFLVLWT
jgi:hypothetical protein